MARAGRLRNADVFYRSALTVQAAATGC